MIAITLSPRIISSVAIPSSSTSLGITGLAKVADALDNAIRADLQDFSQSMFACVIASTAVLILGCILELPELLFDLWPEWFSWFTWTSEIKFKKVERKLKFVGLFGWALVGVGIGGEAIFETLQNRAEGQLQTFNDIILTEARLTASRAKDSAIVAGEVAKDARRDADAAQGTANKVKGEADALGKQIEAEQKEASIIKEMVQRTGPRDTLLILNRDLVIKTLKPFAGQKFIVKNCGPDSREKQNLFGELTGLLMSAKWDGFEFKKPCLEEPTGVLLTSLPTNEVSTKARDALAHLLVSININALNDMQAIDGRTGLPTVIESDPAQQILKIDPTMVVIRIGYNPIISPSLYKSQPK